MHVLRHIIVIVFVLVEGVIEDSFTALGVPRELLRQVRLRTIAIVIVVTELLICKVKFHFYYNNKVNSKRPYFQCGLVKLDTFRISL